VTEVMTGEMSIVKNLYSAVYVGKKNRGVLQSLKQCYK